MIAFIFFIIANLLLLIFGNALLRRYSGYRDLSLGENIIGSFVIGVILNFFIFFLLGWSQIGFGIVIPMYILVGGGIVGFLFWKKELNLTFKKPVFPKYEFSFKHIPLIILSALIIFRVFFSFFQAIHLPAYFDDEKGNWNLKSKVIYSGQGIMLDPSDEDTYVGGGGHKEYPLGFILYKTYITQFIGYWDDGLTALVHPLFFYFSMLVILSGLLKSTPTRIVMFYLVCSIPLVSWHAGVSYYDLIIATELSLIYYFFLRYRETKNTSYIHLMVWIALLALNTKNEGAVLVYPSLLPLLYSIIKDRALPTLKSWGTALLPFLLTIPHLIFRAIYHLSFNPHSSSASYGWHGEGLHLLWQYFFLGGSYNIFWYILPFLLIFSYKKILHGGARYIFASIFLFFLIALSVFLFTNNFQYLLDQTTIHRTMLIFMVPMTIMIVYIHEKEIALLFKKHPSLGK